VLGLHESDFSGDRSMQTNPPPDHPQGGRNLNFALLSGGTILVGAFLLFQVQPVISKMILPWFGGSSAVWSTCMLFFQMVLLAGYGYAHLLTRLFTPRRQVMVHAGLIVLALVTLPITPSDSLRPIDGSNASFRILTVLGLSVGLPYFLLSSTGPLVQAWFGRVYHGRSPYRLYALSNIGSLAALLSYPFLIEPRFTLPQQDRFWSAGMIVYALLSVGLAYALWRFADRVPLEADQIEEQPEAMPPAERKLLWVLLPTLGSVALLAVTNHLSQDVAAVPFLWVMPLSLYLITFILCFDSDRWYQRWLFCPLAILSILWVSLIEAAPHLDDKFRSMNWNFTLSGAIDRFMGTLIGWANIIPAIRSLNLQFQTNEIDYNPVFQGLFYLSFLFFGCMVCHGELARLKPGKQFLTSYYLMIAAGGALGGVFVALMCPVLFAWYAELPLAQAAIFLVAAVGLSLALLGRIAQHQWLRFLICAIALGAVGTFSGDAAVRRVETEWIRAAVSLVMAFIGAGLAYGIVATSRRELQILCTSVGGLLMLSAAFGLVLGGVLKVQDPAVIAAERSFYGALQVRNDGDSEPVGRWLTHGRIQHGYQHLDDELRRLPTTYYVPKSGIGLAIERHPNAGELKIGVVGLGAGTIAAYGDQASEIRFYEIDDLVERFSRTYFTYREESSAKIEVVLGDARLSMEREEPQEYDILAIDAFSGDAIPVHLLTRECLDVYLKHLKPDGILAIHISNRYLDLAPIVRALAQRAGMRAENVYYREQETRLRDTTSDWMLLSRNEAFFNDPDVQAALDPADPEARVIEWTDHYSNLWDILQQ
jgi:spermidine synthase